MPYTEAEFAVAISEGQFRLVFQPLIARHSRRVAGVEALVRWQHPQRGFLGPAAFLPAMESAGQMGALTDWAILRAAQTCAGWREAGVIVPVSVNLSATLLHDTGLADRVLARLELFTMPADLLTLEVTETALAQPGQAAVRVLDGLRRAGISISVDDFGTGYTSLAMLKKYTFDEIKIDRSFVASLPHSPADAAIVRSILELGHRLDLTVVAEGIEDEATARLLEEMGCDVLQGFHFAKPGTAAEVLRIVAASGTTSSTTSSDPPGTGGPVAVQSAWPTTAGAVDARAGHGSSTTADSTTAASAAAASALSATGERLAAEEARLAALTALHVLDTDPEQVLDDVAEIAAAVCGTPTALLSFVDRDRQWFKARLGVTITETPREVSFCAHTIQQPGAVFEVPDARRDERFAANPLVTGDPNIRFYAGAPLVTADGYAVGTLCVLDFLPRSLTATQRVALDKLAQLAMCYLQVGRTEVFMQRLQQVSRVLSQMHAEQDVPDVASTVASAAREIIGADGAVMFLQEEPGSVVFRPAGISTELPADAAAMAAVVIDSRAHRAPAAAIRGREPVFIADARHNDLISPAMVDRFRMASSLCLPLQDGASVIGVLAVWWTSPQDTQPKPGLTALSMLANEAGNTLARLYARSGLRRVTETDPLTGLLNRRAFAAKVKGLPADSVLIMIDLDRFKQVNGRHGHQAGDQALKSFAAHLRAAARAHDVIARWGGEEFALALPASSGDGASSLLARLRESWTDGPTTFSAGVAVLGSAEHAASAIDRADAALNVAKRAGLNHDHYEPPPDAQHPPGQPGTHPARRRYAGSAKRSHR